MRLWFLSLACLALSAGALRADVPGLQDSFYVRLGLGESLRSAASVQDTPGGAVSTPGAGREDDFGSDWALGWQSTGHFGVEVGFTGTNDAGGLATDTSYLMPTWRLTQDGFFGSPCFHTFGLRIGQSNLDSPREWDGPFGDFTDDMGDSTALSLCYRFEQMLGGFVSLGLDFTYTWVSYPVLGLGGSQVNQWNGSGPGLKLSLAFWPLRPFAPPDAPYGTDAAALWLRKGDALMARRRYERAVSAYSTALEQDPKNRWAWQGLGNAFYFMGQTADALGAYEHADALAGGDKGLEALEGKLRAVLRKPGSVPEKTAP